LREEELLEEELRDLEQKRLNTYYAQFKEE